MYLDSLSVPLGCVYTLELLLLGNQQQHGNPQQNMAHFTCVQRLLCKQTPMRDFIPQRRRALHVSLSGHPDPVSSPAREPEPVCSSWNRDPL